MLQATRWATAAIVVSIGLPGIATAATLNVPGDFATIQACIDAAVSGVDECVVAPGTYHETINFLGKAITLRSSGGADVTTIDATGIGGSVVTCASGEGPNTILDGFTITGGTGTIVDYFAYGGGMYNDHSSPTVTNCAFSGNTATSKYAYDAGGGMYNSGGSPTVTHCSFSENTADDGGGMSNSNSNPTVVNCRFSENLAYWFGGGMCNNFSSPTVTTCTFSGNTGAFAGGGMASTGGHPTVSDCTFSGNIAYFYGGGMFNEAQSSPKVANCAFVGNTRSGMYNYGSSPAVGNCTFSMNTGSGMDADSYSNPTVTNSIFWADRIWNNRLDSAPVIRFSDVEGGLPVGAVDGGGNVDLDPRFVRPPDPGPDGTWDGVDDDYGDLRLQAGSPCIDAGDPGFVAPPGETDLDGHARVLCRRVDMGAYEFGIGDYNCDRVVDLADFSSWQACMTAPIHTEPFHSTIDIRQSTISCEAFDFNADGDVDLLDFDAFQMIFGR